MNKQLFIVHGYQATPKDHWFQWLAKEMHKEGYQTTSIPLPHSDQPNYEEWQNTLHHYLDGHIDDDTIIVAHSLGVISVLSYLTSLPYPIRLKGLFLVAGFNEPLPHIPQLDTFIHRCDVRYNKVQAQYMYTIAASEDPAVPLAATNRVSHGLNISTTIVQHQGHFLAREGFTSFEALKGLLLNIDQ
ncbi:RBBP9/YdeN family alpha/beta hydrolase [Staphylococcus argensis]|uniref:Esterase n=1 Tax=Staphylococcus argensis TaxID=1607738 RepID=A0A2K4FF97_9STAP|nr:alpha/beta hydrolase [Staphylococcus argensis]MCY6990466.1 alpha/beta hydrolase [Staphylococcus argensis]POA09977.1 esterase [Staphylococcus argensis]